MIPMIRFPLLSCLITQHDQPSLIFNLEFSFFLKTLA